MLILVGKDYATTHAIRKKRKEKGDLQCPGHEDALWLATVESKIGAGKRRSMAKLVQGERKGIYLYLYIVASIELFSIEEVNSKESTSR
jgi:hypothetical protein